MASASTEAATTQSTEPAAATSKYGRLRSRPSAAAATAATTTAGAGAATTTVAAATAAGGRTNNSYLSKLKAKSAVGAAATAASGEAATLTPTTSSGSGSSNDITQKQHKFQPASFALRRQFQTRRLTTFAPATNGDESGECTERKS